MPCLINKIFKSKLDFGDFRFTIIVFFVELNPDRDSYINSEIEILTNYIDSYPSLIAFQPRALSNKLLIPGSCTKVVDTCIVQNFIHAHK